MRRARILAIDPPDAGLLRLGQVDLGVVSRVGETHRRLAGVDPAKSRTIEDHDEGKDMIRFGDCTREHKYLDGTLVVTVPDGDHALYDSEQLCRVLGNAEPRRAAASLEGRRKEIHVEGTSDAAEFVDREALLWLLMSGETPAGRELRALMTGSLLAEIDELVDLLRAHLGDLPESADARDHFYEATRFYSREQAGHRRAVATTCIAGPLLAR
jgi:hypothetical protein